MKKWLISLMALVLILIVSSPPVSAAPGRSWDRRGREGFHEFHGRESCVACGVVGGLVLGGIVGGLIAHAYAAPPPVVAAPAPACYTQPGYWGQAPVTRPDGYTSYQQVWVPPQTVCQ